VRTKRYILICVLCVLLGAPLWAQSSLSLGVRGGGQMWLPKAADESTTLKSTIGGGALLDIRYAYYGRVSNTFSMGLNIGLDAGYGVAGVKGTNSASFTNTDYLGNQMDYTTSASFTQQEAFLRTDFSLMLAMRAGGFVANIGPRLMMPFVVSPKLTINEANIEATYPQYNVTVSNELITGVLPTPYTTAVTNPLAPLTLLLGLEIGYEFQLSKNAIGLQAYADVGIWNYQKAGEQDLSPMISVNPIAEAAPAEVVVNTNGAAVAQCRMIDFGLRIYYAFSLGSSRPDTNPSRDSKDHRNRYLY